MVINVRSNLPSLKVRMGVGLAPKDLGGTSDPYAIVKFGNIKQRTSIQKNTINPSKHIYSSRTHGISQYD